jgi:hypothetical protein
MVRLNMCDLLWLSDGGAGTKCVVHRVETDFARRTETRQPPSLINMDDVMRACITSSAIPRASWCTRQRSGRCSNDWIQARHKIVPDPATHPRVQMARLTPPLG